jgi:hypothetical protein
LPGLRVKIEYGRASWLAVPASDRNGVAIVVELNKARPQIASRSGYNSSPVEGYLSWTALKWPTR